MSTERDELARLIDDAPEHGCGCCADYGTKEQDQYGDTIDVGSRAVAITDRILAAGYRKTRTVSTEAELDALPVGTVVLSEAYAHFVADFPVTFQKWPDGYWYRGGRLSDTHPDNFLPATVLSIPGADR